MFHVSTQAESKSITKPKRSGMLQKQREREREERERERERESKLTANTNEREMTANAIIYSSIESLLCFVEMLLFHK